MRSLIDLGVDGHHHRLSGQIARSRCRKRDDAALRVLTGRSHRGERSEPSFLQVLDRRHDLFARVHHERPMADDRLVDRLAGQHEERRVLVASMRSVAGAVEVHELRRARRRAPLTVTPPRSTRDARRMPVRHASSTRVARVSRTSQTSIGVKVMRRALRRRRTRRRSRARARRRRQARRRESAPRDRLVAGRRHLVLRRQVDPELHHLERAAARA